MEVIAILLVIFIVGVSVVVFISTSGIVPRKRIHNRPRKIVNLLSGIRPIQLKINDEGYIPIMFRFNDIDVVEVDRVYYNFEGIIYPHSEHQLFSPWYSNGNIKYQPDVLYIVDYCVAILNRDIPNLLCIHYPDGQHADIYSYAPGSIDGLRVYDKLETHSNFYTKFNPRCKRWNE